MTKPRTRPVPEWAQGLIEEVCSDYGRRLPRVTWYERDEWFSSGRTYCQERRIHVTAGTGVVDTRITVLHELAHFLGRPTWHHNRRFWELAWELYVRYAEPDLDWVLFRESHYKSKALTYCPLVSA